MAKSKFLKEKCFLRRLERQSISPGLNLSEYPELSRDKESHHSDSRVSTLSSHPLRPKELEDPQTKQTGPQVIKSRERNAFKDPEKVQNTV